jgi:hypothetical protein
LLQIAVSVYEHPIDKNAPGSPGRSLAFRTGLEFSARFGWAPPVARLPPWFPSAREERSASFSASAQAETDQPARGSRIDLFSWIAFIGVDVCSPMTLSEGDYP